MSSKAVSGDLGPEHLWKCSHGSSRAGALAGVHTPKAVLSCWQSRSPPGSAAAEVGPGGKCGETQSSPCIASCVWGFLCVMLGNQGPKEG